MNAPVRSAGTSGSAAFLDTVLDHGSFRPWDAAPLSLPPGADTAAYRAALRAAAERCGTDESIVTGEGRMEGRRVAIACSEFAFLAGSIGVNAAQRLLLAVERATAERLPLIAAPASGGTRMQEGTPAFLRMAALANAVTAHKAAGLPYLVYLRHPTTGGVFASWGSLGHVTFAEPGALVGFLGPKVYSALHGEEFPAGIQTAENLHAHGLIDAVQTPERFASTTRRLLRLLADDRPAGHTRRLLPPPIDAGPPPEAWAAVTATRRHDRPGLADLLRSEASNTVRLSGTGQGEPGHGMILCVTQLGRTPCVLVGHDRLAQADSPLAADALRTARRGIRLAEELRVPLVSVIDTPGAALSPSAEETGLAGEIARCLADLGSVSTVTVSVLLGQGCGGAALALLPADRVVAARNGWLTPLPPEGASAIVHGTTDRAEDLAAAQHIRSHDLLRVGAVDRIVDELPDAAGAFLRRLTDAVEAELATAAALSPAERAAGRARRYRSVGLGRP